MGKNNEYEPDKQQLSVEDSEELIQEEIAQNEPGLSAENLESEPATGLDEEAAVTGAATDDLWSDAFTAAQVIEESKKEKPGLKDKIKGAFRKHDDRSEEKRDNNNPETDSRMAALRNELEAKDTQLKRLAADFDNFRRRQGQEREDLLKYGGEKLILDILPILDNFERAMLSSKDAKDIASVISGIELIQKQLAEVMKRNGVETIEAMNNPFDPNYHEAVQQLVDDEKPDHTVINELQKGFTLNGRVIRPSMVIVSTTSE